LFFIVPPCTSRRRSKEGLRDAVYTTIEARDKQTSNLEQSKATHHTHTHTHTKTAKLATQEGETRYISNRNSILIEYLIHFTNNTVCTHNTQPKHAPAAGGIAAQEQRGR